jgi:hypothetical protein
MTGEKKPKIRRGVSTSFYLHGHDQEALDYLCHYYNVGPSVLLRKLITEAYTICKYEKDKEALCQVQTKILA